MGPAAALVLGLLYPDAAFAGREGALLVFGLAAGTSLLALRRERIRLGIGFLLAAAFTLGACAALPVALPPPPGAVGRLAAERPGLATLSGRVASRVAAVPGRASFDLEVSETRAGGVIGPSRGRVRLTLSGLPEDGVPVLDLEPGDEVEAQGMLAEARDFATPGVASRRAHLRRQGVSAIFQVKAPELFAVRARRARGPVARLRRHVAWAIDTYVAGGRRPAAWGGSPLEVVPESRAAAVLKAMLIDDRAQIDDDDTRALAQAGILHVLSISGLHVAIVAGLAWWLAGRLRLGTSGRAVAALAVLWLYVLVASSPAPAVRTAVVSSAVLAGRAVFRDSTAPNLLALALLVGGVLEPGGIREPGFQMTYAAAAGLLLVAPPIARGLRRLLPRVLASALAASLGAELAVLGPSLVHFGRVTLWGPAVNLLAVPLAAASVVSGFALAAAAAIHPALARPVGALARWSVDLLFAVGGVPGWGSFRLASPPAGLAIAFAAALALPLLGRGGEGRASLLSVSAGSPGSAPGSSALQRWRILWIAPALVAGALLLRPPLPASLDPGALRLTFLDVGQGDAALVEHPGGTLLVDAGGFPRSRFDVGDRVVVPFLLASGHRRLDRALVTHAHPDHAAGMAAVLRDLAVGELWLGDDPPGDALARELGGLARRLGDRVVSARAGASVEADLATGTWLRVLNPPPGLAPPAEVENGRSLVVELAAPGGRVLLTGDVDAEAEGRIAAAGLRPAVLLKVAHHGSRTSSSAAFLAAARPRLAVVSCGFRNRFHHPDAAVLERLATSGARVLRTDLDGTVTVTLDRDGHLRLETARARFLTRVPGPEEGPDSGPQLQAGQ